jgi:nucleoside-diphosphate-sugar epimerase
VEVTARYGPKRPGDVRDSLADITMAREKLGFSPSVDIADGLREYVDWVSAGMELSMKAAYTG